MQQCLQNNNTLVKIIIKKSNCGPPPTSYSTETYAILNGLEWCISHSSSGAFRSVTLFSDSQSVLTSLPASLSYLLSKSLTDTQPLLNSLTDSKVVHLQYRVFRSNSLFFAIKFVLQKLLHMYLCIGSPDRVYIYIYDIYYSYSYI